MIRSRLCKMMLIGMGLFTGLDRAFAHVELNLFYDSDSLSTGTAATSTKMFIDGTVGFEIDRKGMYLVGWNYSLYSTSETSATTTTYASTQMGPRFLVMLDKNKNWSVGLSYNLVTTATYSDGSGTSEKWKGTGIKADLGYTFALSDSIRFGLRLNYSMTSYVEKLVGDTDYSVISYSRSTMYPSVYTVILF